jgi:hypothetical protein
MRHASMVRRPAVSRRRELGAGAIDGRTLPVSDDPAFTLRTKAVTPIHAGVAQTSSGLILAIVVVPPPFVKGTVKPKNRICVAFPPMLPLTWRADASFTPTTIVLNVVPGLAPPEVVIAIDEYVFVSAS